MTDLKDIVERLRRPISAVHAAGPIAWDDQADAPLCLEDLISEREEAATALSRSREREAELEGEIVRLKPVPREFEAMYSTVYRSGPPTVEDYDEALEALENARTALSEGDSMGCRVCEDSGHGANSCHHNPLLLARKWAAASRFWQCWHCGFVATNDAEGREHFGDHDGETPSCVKAALETRAQSAERERDEAALNARVATLAELRAVPDDEVRALLAQAQIMAGYPADDDPDGNDADIGQRFIALRHKIGEVFARTTTAEAERDEALSMLHSFDAPTHHEDGAPLSMAGRICALHDEWEAAAVNADKGCREWQTLTRLAESQRDEALSRVGELEKKIEGLQAAISWLEPPFVTYDTDKEELHKRIGFMLADVDRLALSPTRGGAEIPLRPEGE